MSIPALRIIAFTIALAAFSGCASTQKQLERVAKDWSMTIRASQVIPVYPLTEDLQPGDVFLVTVPVQKQVEIYKKKGFLPLDLMVTRLHGLDYKAFYAAEYWAGDFSPEDKVGHARMVRGAEKKPAKGVGGGTPPPTENNLTANLSAPRAAFPTYTFSVEKGFGARLAIPVQGVPVAMGLMGSSSAYGSVTISDAYTYAAPTEDLIEKLNAWIMKKPRVKEMLSNLHAANDQTLYLRVVQRVYMTGGVVVSVTNSQSGGAAVEADLSALGNSGGEAGSAAGTQGTGTAVPEKTAVALVETFIVDGTWAENDTLTTTIAITDEQGGKKEKSVQTKVDVGKTSATEVRNQHLGQLKEASKDPAFKDIVWKDDSTSIITGTGEAGVKFVADVKVESAMGKYTKAGTSVQAPPPGAGYAETSTALNDALAGGNKPGASLQIIQASSRSVTMKENFDRPLVIGYIGFDFPIRKDGELGVPIATLNQLENRKSSVASAIRGEARSNLKEESKQIDLVLTCVTKSDRSLDGDKLRELVDKATNADQAKRLFNDTEVEKMKMFKRKKDLSDFLEEDGEAFVKPLHDQLKAIGCKAI